MSEKIRIGFPVPLSGIYGVEAKEQLTAAQIAVADFNSEGGLDGRLAELVVRDTQLQIDIAKAAAEELIVKEKIHVMVGALSAGDMLQISRICDRYHKLYNAISQSDSILYRENRSRFTFHEGANPHMSVGSAGRYAFSHLGNRIAFLNANAEFGQHSKRALLHVGEQIGIDIVKNIDYPIGSKDFRPFLAEIRKEKPEVLVLNNFGDDQMLSVQQASEMGLKDEMRLVCPNISVTQVTREDAKAFEGVVGSTAYYWRLEESIASAKTFNQKYRAASGGIPPTGYSTFGYNGVRTVLECIRRTKSLKTKDLVEEMLALRYDFCKGTQFYRRLDHQAIQCVVIVEVKGKKDMLSPDDHFEILELVEFLGPRAFLISRETQ